MARRTIAVDIDDVLSSQTDMIIRFSKEKHGLNLTYDNFMSPGDYWGYYEKVWGIGKKEGAKRFKEFLEEEYPLKQTIPRHTIEVIERLKASYDLVIVTSRGLDYQEGTMLWLEEHLPDVFKGIHFVELWNRGDIKATKAHICQDIGADYLIDDNAEHCNMAAEAGLKALLFGEFGWNIWQDLHPTVKRVHNWYEVAKYFNV